MFFQFEILVTIHLICKRRNYPQHWCSPFDFMRTSQNFNAKFINGLSFYIESIDSNSFLGVNCATLLRLSNDLCQSMCYHSRNQGLLRLALTFPYTYDFTPVESLKMMYVSLQLAPLSLEFLLKITKFLGCPKPRHYSL